MNAKAPEQRLLLILIALLAGPLLLHAGDSAESFYKRGLALEKAKRYSSALAFYEASNVADPKYAPSLKEAGNCHYYLGEKEKALKAYEAYLLLKSDDKIIQALALKMRPPTPVPMDTLAAALGPKAKSVLFEDPEVNQEGATELVKSWGRFQYPVLNVRAAVSELLKNSWNLGPLFQDLPKGWTWTSPFLVNRGVFFDSVEQPGLNSSFSLKAVVEDSKGFVQVRWELFEIYDFMGNEANHPKEGDLAPAPGTPPSAEELRRHDEEILEKSRKFLNGHGLPTKSKALETGLSQKLQNDWNYRLWVQLTSTPIESGGGNGKMNVMGWDASRGSKYNLYMSTTSGKDYKKMNDATIGQDTFMVEHVVIGKRYYFVLTNVDPGGAESKPSQEFSKIATADGK